MKDLLREVIIGLYAGESKSFIFLMMRKFARQKKYVTKMHIFYFIKKWRQSDVYDET